MNKKYQKNGLLYSFIASVIIATFLAVLLVFTYVRQNNVAKYLDENYSLLVDWNKGEVSKDPDAVDVPKVEYKGLKKSETASSSSDNTSSSNDDNYKFNTQNPDEWSVVLTRIQDNKPITLADIQFANIYFKVYIDNQLAKISNPTAEQKQAVENGKTMMDEIEKFYQNANTYNRNITNEERSIMLSNIHEIIDVMVRFAG